MHRGRWIAAALTVVALLAAGLVGFLAAPSTDDAERRDGNRAPQSHSGYGTPPEDPSLSGAPTGRRRSPPPGRPPRGDWLLRDPEGAFHVRVLAADGEPVVGAAVRVRNAHGGFSDGDQVSGPGGMVRIARARGERVVHATHPDHGVGTARGFAPGRAEVRLGRGPEVLVDASALPASLRGKLAVLELVTSEPTLCYATQVPLAGGLVSLGRWPPGRLSIRYGPDPWHLQSTAFTLPTTDRVTCPLEWDGSRDGARLRLEGHRGPWALTLRRENTPHLGWTMGHERIQADAEGYVSFPWGLPTGTCYVEIPGRCPRWFDADGLPRDESGDFVVPADEGCACTVILDEPLGFEVDIEVLGFTDAARRDVDLESAGVAFGVVIAGHTPRTDLAWLGRTPHRVRGRQEFLVPSHAVIGLTGCGPARQVRMTVRTGAPGTSLEVRPHPEPCASLRLRGSNPARHGDDDWAFASSRLRGHSGDRKLAVRVDHGVSGDALVEGLPLPFEGEVVVTKHLRSWRYPVVIATPGEQEVSCDTEHEEPADRYEIRVRTPEGRPVHGALVRWSRGPGRHSVTNRTDAAGLAALEAAGPWHYAEVHGREARDVGTMVHLHGPGRHEVTWAEPALLAVQLGPTHTGRRRRIRVLREGLSVLGAGMGTTVVLGATATCGSFREPGPHVVILLDDTGKELARRKAALVVGQTTTVQFD